MPNSAIHPILATAIAASRAAGDLIARAAFGLDAVQVIQKRANDYVTEVDRASEAMIIEALLAAYPEYGILAEESGQMHGTQGAESVWIIDPLDGTNNFIHGYPAYCVSIALAVHGRIEHAVIYDPTRGELFHASLGGGAYLNGRRLRVSRRTALHECLVSTSCPYRPGPGFEPSMQMLGDVMRVAAGIRRSGTAALDMAHVAAGVSDAFFDLELNAWDVAAGSLLVTEAGGAVGNFAGGADFLDRRECMAAAPGIHAQLLAVLSRYSRA